MSLLKSIFGKPDYLLKAPSLEESKKECTAIKATQKEVAEAKKCVSYICTRCGYHSGIIRKCPACNGWMRYWKLSERIRHLRDISEANSSR